MPDVKKTKTALKAQREALKRFERYLPTLELKKQQIKLEISSVERAIEEKQDERRRAWDGLTKWLRLFADDADLKGLIRLRAIETGVENIAGINAPTFERVVFERAPVDLFETPPWVDDGLDMIETLIGLEAEERVLEQSREILKEELRITSQRVNLFEKVKIPQCRENIRIVRIALADEQTAAVGRAKMAKDKLVELESATL